MKGFCFTVDDNIRFLKELTEGNYASVFEHPYMGVYKRLHDRLALKVQLNLFYQTTDGSFDLSKMTDRFKQEWLENADWLKLSFHSRLEDVRPYESSGYDEVFTDCKKVHREICRFAGEQCLGKTTTVHFCLATKDGVDALKDNGVQGLLGLYGNSRDENLLYQLTGEQAKHIARGEIVYQGGIAYAGIDIVLNLYKKTEILSRLQTIFSRDMIKVMIHEQYFYSDYPLYQKDFEEKLYATFAELTKRGFYSSFFEEWR
jgi:hypothetical protein